MNKLGIILTFIFLVSCQSKAQESKKEKATYKVTKTDAEWKKQLPEMSYYVLRRAGTEPAFNNEYNDNKKSGTYVCRGCNTPLYLSKHKYDSGSGWPAFDRAIDKNVAYDVDYKIGYQRKEVHCATCGGHLGHVFKDGPRETTGVRHCINSAAMKFIPKKNE